jgi:peroxiredoxin
VKATGAVVLGVSPDPVASHVKFRRKYALPFQLLADTDHQVAEAYGAWGEKSMYGRKYFGILRSTFVIAPMERFVTPSVRSSPRATPPKSWQPSDRPERPSRQPARSRDP